MREVDDQVHQISCLCLLATAVIVWNTVYIAEAVDCLKQAKYEIHDTLALLGGSVDAVAAQIISHYYSFVHFEIPTLLPVGVTHCIIV